MLTCQLPSEATVTVLTAQHGRLCRLCGSSTRSPECARIHSNVRRFLAQSFEMWRCGACGSLHSQPVEDLAGYYRGYPARRQGLGYHTRAWYGVVLRRLVRAGLGREDSLLDYGCGHGLFLEYLREKGYGRCHGYDAYEPHHADAALLADRYDCVVAMEVLEHAEDPSAMLAGIKALVRPGGCIYLSMPNADGIDLASPAREMHAIHQPYHRHIPSLRAACALVAAQGLSLEEASDTTHMNHWWPATSERFVKEYSVLLENVHDAVFEPPPIGRIIRSPRLWLEALAGYFLPRRGDYMTLVVRRPAGPAAPAANGAKGEAR